MSDKPHSPDVKDSEAAQFLREQHGHIAEDALSDFEESYPDGAAPCSGGPSKRVRPNRPVSPPPPLDSA